MIFTSDMKLDPKIVFAKVSAFNKDFVFDEKLFDQSSTIDFEKWVTEIKSLELYKYSSGLSNFYSEVNKVLVSNNSVVTSDLKGAVIAGNEKQRQVIESKI